MFQEYKEITNLQRLDDSYKYFDELFQHFDIYTTRYNNMTYLENFRYKESMLNEFKGSLYSTMSPLPVSAPYDKYIFVLDMNNTRNKIMGIGFIKNNLANDQTIRVYQDPNFNNYIYKSKFYLPVDEENWEMNWLDFLHEEFEKKLFFGKQHLKRGGSFTRFPLKWMKHKHLKFILSLFIIHNPNDFKNIIKL